MNTIEKKAKTEINVIFSGTIMVKLNFSRHNNIDFNKNSNCSFVFLLQLSCFYTSQLG